MAGLQPALTLSALNCAVQNVIAAKRYACPHLLALRFSDVDEGYSEDVGRLLISTLADISSRILEASYEQSLQDQIPTPFSVLPNSEDETTFKEQNQNPSCKSPKTEGRVSVAPNAESYIAVCSSCRGYHFCAG